MQQKSLRLFNDLYNALTNSAHQSRVWLEFGTLLGAYREKRVIKHDTDIDLGVMENDVTPQLLESLKANGFKPRKKYIIKSKCDLLNGFVAEYNFLYDGIISVDLFIFKQRKNSKHCFNFELPERKINLKLFRKKDNALRISEIRLHSFELTTMYLFENPFYAPSNTNEHLVEIYGADFMTPKSYSYENRPKNHEHPVNNGSLGLAVKFRI